MNYETILFCLFSGIALSSAIFVIFSTNTVYSTFFLILTFTNITGLLLIYEIEFISIMLIIIYVGAIVVLFLFVLMMLDIDIKKNNIKKIFEFFPLIFSICLTFFIELFIIFDKIFNISLHKLIIFKDNIEVLAPHFLGFNVYWYDIEFFNKFLNQLDNITNIDTLGQILYTYYTIFFLIAGIILLIALIGAVMLTTKKKKSIISRNSYQQLSRNSIKAIFNINKKI